MTPALTVRGLTVALHGRPLVDGLTFDLAPGEKVALLGASGSGKSLTAAAVLGALPATMDASGELQLDGRALPLMRKGVGSAVRAARGIAAVHQDPTTALNPLVPLGKQLAIPLRREGHPASAARELAAGLLAAVGIADPVRVLAGYSGELSGGELQRVCIALALACCPRVLVADEPTTALDMVNQAKVLDVLAQPSAQGHATLFITHDLAVAQVLCSRALVLCAGRIVEQGPLDTLLSRPAHPYTARLVEAARAVLPSAEPGLTA
ncbi:ABC transporter ATP-binding protein [Arthrobacter sp. B10-11]|uniref:ABC transporter ATP-binding protein n=1 Tax=Arthrobacter sp. B10-11 TaxID=3081160 RepID=UPI0029556FA6|nr:ABC transporter ATP-binding protein [Arthrobacter sp. B10-11]MDV8149762.1 ABC transporter ATP-binding protein [Arthrobacter sp. B10-11]